MQRATRNVGMQLLLACSMGLISTARVLADASVTSDRAEALFVDGKRLLAVGDYAAACPMFAASFALDAATGTLLALAICHERAGDLAAAVSEYASVAERSDTEHRSDRAQAARAKLAELEPKLPKQESPPPTASATELRADPQPEFRAAASVSSPSARDESLFTSQEWLGLGTATLGLVGVGIGTVFGLQAMQKNQDSMSGCNGDLCTPAGRSDRLSARSAGDAATVAFLAGGGLAITGLVLYFSDRGVEASDDHAALTLHAAAWAAPHVVGGGVFGAFE